MQQLQDELRADRGRGRLSPKTEREFLELQDGNHPRTCLSPSCEMEIVDERCALADEDERRTMWDPNEHPKVPHLREEAVTDREGTRLVDVQRDSPLVDDLAEFDLSTDDLFGVDL